MAAVTGAGSGIGRAISVELARRGAEVALSDVDESGMQQTAEMVREAAGSAKVSQHKVDVADREQVRQWAKAVVAEHGRVNMIINNAGVALGAMIRTMSYEDLAWLMGINFWGVVHGTKEFLGYLEDSGEGHVVNLSSVFGFVGIPSQGAYNAAKFAVRGFTEALQIELEMAGSCVSASCVHPGGVKTSIARNARIEPDLAASAGGEDAAKANFEKIFITSPEKAARQILDGVARNRRRILVGPDAPLMFLLGCLPASVYERLVAKAASRNFRASR